MLEVSPAAPPFRGPPWVLEELKTTVERRNKSFGLKCKVIKRKALSLEVPADIILDMDSGHRDNIAHLQDLAEDEDFNAGHIPEVPDTVNMAGVLDGSERIEISHAGGEFRSLEEDLEEDTNDEYSKGKAR